MKKARPYNLREWSPLALYIIEVTGAINIKALSDKLGYNRFTVHNWLKHGAVPKLPNILNIIDYLSGYDGQSPEYHLIKIMECYPEWNLLTRRHRGI